MQIYIIQRKIVDVGKIDSLHTHLFHGKAELPGYFWWNASRNLGDSNIEPLLVSREGSQMPQVFQPLLNLVVSSEVMTKLKSVARSRFTKVRFIKIINFPYQVKDFSYYDRSDYLDAPDAHSPDSLIDRLPDQPSMYNNIGDYYEIIPIAPRLTKVSTSLNVPIRFPAGDPSDWHEMIETTLSPQLLEEYSIIWDASTILNQRSFDQIVNAVDWNFFWLHSVSI